MNDSPSRPAPDYAEFSDPRLVAIYDTVNPIDSYRAFFIDLAERLSPRSIIDVGAGTGLLTCELAAHGYQMTGIEPSKPLLDLARLRSGCKDVRWIEGNAQELGDTTADLVIMSGHVAQFFLDEESWDALLAQVHASLVPGGHFVFDSRNPHVPRFGSWPTEASRKTLTDPVAGDVEWWAKIQDNDAHSVRYEIHYRFLQTGDEVVSRNELVFRTEDELRRSLSATGFNVQEVFGDWDRSALTADCPEMIFVTRRD